MMYKCQSLLNLCMENERIGKMLIKLYTTTKDQWVNASDLREECGINLKEWRSFTNRAGEKCGVGVLEIHRDIRKSSKHTMVRLSPGNLDIVKKIIDKLYEWVV